MKCPKCHADNREGAKFCIKCGEKLEFKCPQCNKALPVEAIFCDECGYDLRKPAEPPPINYSEPQSYTPKHLADKILTSRSTIEGERKLVTVLFADVANYTSMAEKLDPEEVHQIMDGCFKILMDEIHWYEGTINQFAGDGLMALFGAPVSHEDHAQRACHAALSIKRAIGSYSEKVNKNCGADFQMRIGINSGPVIVGSIGDDLRMDYTAVGNTTNLASRMESMARPGTIFISGNTQRLARDFFEFESLGKFKVKGKEGPQEVFELIKTGEVETRMGASVAKGLTRFVGRKNSMAALMDAFDKVKSGSGQVVGLVGEAGVGKSRLLLEMRNMLPQSKYHYLEGRCLQYGGSITYLPILDILRSYFEIKEGDREFIIKKKMEEKALDLDEKLKGILPPFHELLSLKVDDEGFIKLEPKDKRERTFEAIRDLLIRVSQGKPLILAIEDLHWIDKTSEEFLGYLIDWLANTPILLILLYRPEYGHQWGSKSYYIKVGVAQLGTPSSTELIQAILEEGQVTPELKQLILNRAAGNPLFMEEFTYTLLDNGSIKKKDKQYILSRKAADIQVPDTIQGIIAARMDRLEENLKRTMQVASVIGRDFAFRILQTITGMREELKSYLLNLQGLEFIYEKRLFPELEYIFKHALIQEVAYNSLLLKRRKEIHENIGKAIEEIYTERLEEFYEMLAYHYSKSENFEKASQYLKLSGKKAVARHAPAEAFNFYKEALNALKKLPDSEENKKAQIEVCRLFFIPVIILGCPEGSLQIFQEGERLSKEIEDTLNLAHFCSHIGIYHWMAGDCLSAIKFGEDACHAAEEIKDIELRLSSTYDLCAFYSTAGQNRKIIDTAPPVLDLLERTDNRNLIPYGRAVAYYPILCSLYGYSLGLLGNFEKGEVFCKKGIRSATEIGDLRTLAATELWNGWFYGWRGNGKLSIEHWQNCIKYCEEVKYFFIGYAWTGLGKGYYFLGDLETAQKHIAKGIKMQHDIGFHQLLSLQYLALSMAQFGLGDSKIALDSIEKALELADKNNEKGNEGISRIWLGRILSKTDSSRRNEAKESILKGIEILETLKLRPLYSVGYIFLGEFYADTGQKEKALENLRKAEAEFRDMGMDYWLKKTQEVLDRL
ncbi:adenylate/guanylate cyclase domain-containing protein [Thermodesulfobacteriota bacterium]